MKVGIICASGGHLVEALRVLPAFEGKDLFLITYDHRVVSDFKHPKIRKIYRIKFLGATMISLLANFVLNSLIMIRLFVKEKPDILFSTGSEIAIPAFYIGKYFFGAKLIFLESITRIKEPSYTSKSIFAISDLFLVQWPGLLNKFGRKALYKGSLL